MSRRRTAGCCDAEHALKSSRTICDWISPAELEMVQRAVREQCGALDGILDDPANCTFNFSKLACTGGARPDCLTDGERASIGRRFSDLVDEKGKLVYPSYVHGLETDIGWTWIGRSADERGVSGGGWDYPVGFFRDYVHGDPDWQIREFNLSGDLPAGQQGLIGCAVNNAARSSFQSRGWHSCRAAPASRPPRGTARPLMLAGCPSSQVRGG